MTIKILCSGCGAHYSVGDHLAGKKARCKKCHAKLVIPTLQEAGIRVEEVAGVSGPAGPASPDGGERPRKKKRRRPLDESSGAWKLVLGIVLVVAFLGGSIALVVGAGKWLHRDPPIVGKWKGIPQIDQAVDRVMKDGKMNGKMPAAAEGFLRMAAQKFAGEVLPVNIEFKISGTAFYSGNSKALGVPAGADGPWKIIKTEGDIVTVQMGTSTEPFEARIAFRDRDNFSLTRTGQEDQAIILFERVKD
jgi:hypothetical protein